MIAPKTGLRSTTEPLWRRREAVIAAATVLLALLMLPLRPDFLSLDNLRDILLNSSITAVVAAGMTALIVAAEIDISVGAILAVCAVSVALMTRAGIAIPLALLASMGIGGAIGAVNGWLTAGLRIPSIVATLATLGAIRGLLILASHGDTVAVPDPLLGLGEGRLLGLKLPFWGAVAAAVVMGLYLARTRSGRQHYAVGSNPRSAELSGVPVRWVTFRSFVVLGVLTGFAAFLFDTQYTPISPKAQPGFELEVITAVVVGGTDIFGGRGTVTGSVLAAVLLSTITTGLSYFRGWLHDRTGIDLASQVQPAIQGLLILAAVLYDSAGRRTE